MLATFKSFPVWCNCDFKSTFHLILRMHNVSNAIFIMFFCIFFALLTLVITHIIEVQSYQRV